MSIINRHGKLRLTPQDESSIVRSILFISGSVKKVMGVANNAAWYCCLDALDKLKTLPQWKKRTDGRNTVEWRFNKVKKAFNEYEMALIWDNKFRFFETSDLSSRVRALYKDGMTNREYYDFWASLGGTTYTRTKPLVTSLQNKFRIALLHGGVDEEQTDALAWGLCALACLDLASCVYRKTLDIGNEIYHIPIPALNMCFKKFSLQNIGTMWADALKSVRSDLFTTDVARLDNKNIELMKNQLAMAWVDTDNITADMKQSIIECGEDVLKDDKSLKIILDDIDKIEEEHKRQNKL